MTAKQALRVVLVLPIAIATLPPAEACDLCQLYSRPPGRDPARVYAGLLVQSADFGTLQQDGAQLDNPQREALKSTILQSMVGVRASEAWTLQLNVPYVQRSYRRIAESGIETASEQGVGDIALVARFDGAERRHGRWTSRWSASCGLELPTGAGARLAEELHERDTEPAARQGDRRQAGHVHEQESGVHGHDLALGNGAVDLLIGASAHWSSPRFQLDSQLQYAVRRTGDFDYRFADDTHLGASSRWYLRRDGRHEFALGVGLTGEHKGKDRLARMRLDDTAITALYAGPLASYSYTEQIKVELALDLPVRQHNSALQIVPDTRLRFLASARF